MAYKMKELTKHVRVGQNSDGDLDIEVWSVARGWEIGSDIGPMEELFLPRDALDELFDYLRREI